MTQYTQVDIPVPLPSMTIKVEIENVMEVTEEVSELAPSDQSPWAGAGNITQPFWTYRGVHFTRSQNYPIFDVLAIQKLTILSTRVWTLPNARKNRVKSLFFYYYCKKSIYSSNLSPNFNFVN